MKTVRIRNPGGRKGASGSSRPPVVRFLTDYRFCEPARMPPGVRVMVGVGVGVAYTTVDRVVQHVSRS